MLELDEYDQKEVTIAFLKANLLSIFYALPPSMFFLAAYYLTWGHSHFRYANFQEVFGTWAYLKIFAIVVFGIIIHELIHGLTWASFASNGFKSIRYGINWKFVTPYCHCSEPLKLKHYFIGALMPSVILGFAPSLIAIISGNFNILLFGLFFILTAGGDFMVINSIRKENQDALIQDHPSKIGFYVFKQKNFTRS